MEFNKENNSIIIGRIIARSVNGAVIPAEQAVLDDWLQDDGNRQVYETIRNGHPIDDALSAFDGFDVGEGYQYFQASIRRSKSVRYRVWMAAAAAVLLFLSVTLYMNSQKESQPARLASVYNDDIAPGGNRATLTLADGRSVDLSSSHEGIIVDDEITYVDGSLVMDGKTEGNTSESQLRTPDSGLLTLTTPRGGQYQVTLPDGTEVWLNAQSTLRYPSRFTGDEREVELDGEAYFHVRKSESLRDGKAKPFIVKSKGQEITVLGTEFNLSSYSDEKEIITTLVNGKLRVDVESTGSHDSRTDHMQILLPAQQALVKNGVIEVRNADVAVETAWRNGLFSFRQESLESIMRKIAKWYNIDVVFQDTIGQRTFSGTISRYANINEVLETLALTGQVKFELIGRQVIVKTKNNR